MRILHFPRTISACVAIFAATLAPLSAQEGRQLFEAYGLGWTRGGGYGTSVATIGDVNGDLVRDIAVGDPSDARGASGSTGVVEVISGVDGSVLSTLLPGPSEFELGRIVVSVGDVNRDSTSDILAAARVDVVLFSGANGAVLNRLPGAAFPAAATALAGPGDWNGDGTCDLAQVRGGRVLITSGLGSAMISSFGTMATHLAVIPSGTPRVMHLAVLEQGNLTLYSSAAGVLWSLPGYESLDSAGNDLVAVVSGGSATHLLSGSNGSVLQSVPGGTNGCGGADLDGDGVTDFAVGDPLAAGGKGVVRAYSGASGSLLFERVGQENGELMGWDLDMHPGAGLGARPAVIAAAESKFEGSVEAGSVLALAQAAPGEVDGSFRPFGQECNFLSTRLRLGRGLPTIGQTYFFRFDNNTSPTGFQLLVLGASNTSWGGVPLPIRLPGVLPCDLYVSFDVSVPSNFAAFQSLAVPLDSTLVGQAFHLQGLTLLGYPIIETSDAATVTIGN